MKPKRFSPGELRFRIAWKVRMRRRDPAVCKKHCESAKKHRATHLEESRKKDALYRAKNPDKRNAATAAWRSLNKERIKAYNSTNRKKYYAVQTAYKKAHKEQIRTKAKEWNDRHP